MVSRSPIQTRLRAGTAMSGEETPRAEAPELTEAASLQAVLREMRQMREEQAQRETKLAERLQRHEDELHRLRGNQLSLSNKRACVEAGSRRENDRNDDARAGASEDEATRNVDVGNSDASDARPEVGLKLKPDTYDGTVPLREFFSQFILIARANRWDDATKTVALASCLRGKARSILETVQDISSLKFSELKSKLELRFGEGQLSQNFYMQFTSRRQKFGEDLAALGTELERLVRLAYPECPHEVRDKIACAQFISAISDNFVKRTLQLENVTSLNLAIERAKTVKMIQGEGFERKPFNRNCPKSGGGGTQENRKEDEEGKNEQSGMN